MKTKKRVLILAFNKLKHDARINRQIEFVKHQYETTVFCFGRTKANDVEFIEVEQTKLTKIRKAAAAIFLLLRIYNVAYWIMHSYKNWVVKFASENYDIIIANDVETLHLAFSISKGKSKVVFDAHEYAPRHFEDKFWFRLFFQNFNIYYCKRYIPQVAGMTTVCDGLANEYESNFGFRPAIITNAPAYQDLQVSEIDSTSIKIIHHGIANTSRKLEAMLEVMDYLPENYSLDLMLVTPTYASDNTRKYIESLKDFCTKKRNINIIEAVPSHEVVQMINSYDIGLFLLEPVNFNYTFALPNKLFEFIQARLAVAIGPSPEMMKIVKRYENGVVSSDFSPQSIAKCIESISIDSLREMKNKSALAASELNAAKNETIFLKVLKDIS